MSRSPVNQRGSAPRFITRPLSGLGRRACRSGLARERFTQQLRCFLKRFSLDPKSILLNLFGSAGGFEPLAGHSPRHPRRNKPVHNSEQSARNFFRFIYAQRLETFADKLVDVMRFKRKGLFFYSKLL